ncbi:TIGR04283 family arsenosugar biosynthesis glycosyltransferase [Ramlibacter sp. AW1]|uniref:TIGR04283 family arsenosugar biosynthesis glycosyltransferase n=1 Tax=Ramlibacter aurantiacus TaxID=2801330 RepID=A0A936ZD47_9BURK|nr:TIGR04283 family arsenosugar biosynthesis glycosyltransferase [Ramlibacter aurantiacus]MBL0418737.1 TIGR04283 family arsenosugar biosynthesis glycosyltransferase [Ramlibacter aurantiacus]
MQPALSIIVPVLDEAAGIEDHLRALAPLRSREVELIVCDGGSRDATADLARPLADQVLVTPPGRARQMNAGAEVAGAPLLLFLHADTRLPADADRLVRQAIAGGAAWGRFDVRIQGRPWMLRVVAAAMNLRSRCTAIATGDQAIFVTRAAFGDVGGFPDQPLMEDVEISRRLRRLGRPACLRAPVITSGRRWETRGVWRTIVLMWRLRWRYWRGAPAHELAKAYR